MNKKVLAWLLIGIGIVIGAVWYIVANQQGDTNQSAVQTDASKFKSQYSGVMADNRFVFAKPEQIIDIFDRGNGVVFLGFPECPWCQQLAPIVDEAARAEGIEKVYYLNIRDARTNNDATYQKLVEKLQSYLPKDEDGNPRIFVPDVTAVRQGKIVGRFEQEEAADGEEVKPDTFWTTDRRKRAVIQLREMMRQTQQFATVQHDIKNGAMLLDVRTSAEFASGHFANATNLDIEDISRGRLSDTSKDTKIYVYCRSGNRSSQATTMLKAAGFTNVTDLGGLSAVEKMGGKLVQ